MNYFEDSNEWTWLFKNAVDWEEISSLFENEDPLEEQLEVYKDIISQIAKWSQTSLAPRAELLDKDGSHTLEDGKTISTEHYQKTVNEAVELGLFSLCTGKEYGGLELPVILDAFIFTHISRACLSSSGVLNFYSSIIDMLERFCSKEVCERLIPKIMAGEISGSMAMTEADCGSDLGQIRTMASLQDDGSYLLNGSKVFITNAGGGLSFVLARTQGAPEGLKGLSLFLVQQQKEQELNYRVVKLEKKMALNGSTTCEVLFENSIAHLVGEENQGLTYMFYLMNLCRIGVGAQAVGGIEACLDYVEKYATDRKAFSHALIDLPLYKHNFQAWRTQLDAFRAFFIDSFNSFTIYQRLHLKKSQIGELNEEEEKKLRKADIKLRFRTPLVKYYGSELFATISQKSIQALGGHGFMKDHPVERWHRESFALLLYEGTSQIQSMMLFKEIVKKMMSDPALYLKQTIAKHPASQAIIASEKVSKETSRLVYLFNKSLGQLFLRIYKSDIPWYQIYKLLDFKNGLDNHKVDKLIIHSETICEAYSYIETLKVLSKHAIKEESRQKLFWDYHSIVYPKIIGIFTQWEN